MILFMFSQIQDIKNIPLGFDKGRQDIEVMTLISRIEAKDAYLPGTEIEDAHP